MSSLGFESEIYFREELGIKRLSPFQRTFWHNSTLRDKTNIGIPRIAKAQIIR